MKTFELEAKVFPLAELVAEVKRGQEVVLTDRAQPVAKIVPLSSRAASAATPKAGCLKGIWMSPDFDEPLADFRDYME